MTTTSIFDLRGQRAHKAAPARIAADDAYFRQVAEALAEDIREVQGNLEETLLHQTGDAAGRVEREARVDQLRARLHGLRRVELDAVLGRMTPQDGSAPLYVGRL
ncbi:MAG: AAA family ATPase, partial [Dermabacteraceae bacterium]